ncbi:hypothetical protein CYMTET_14431 [Cymbomonas tetramitiformis]|uniref:DDT domain-containing protein n=1 Tax=Cymbomonas tetramitiformis TaxID=36881 RepID=A0AAE0GG00_9CHLO|nr:hypothetical protein CYMTET_14431 [Cymbomonas tetramitiformis]
MSGFGYSEDCEALRSSVEFAQIIHFTRVFENPLKLKPFSADRLEAALLAPGENNKFLSEIHFKLLRHDPYANYNELDAETKWKDLLQKKLKNQSWEFWEENPLENACYEELSACERASILRALCEWRLVECPCVHEAVKASVNSTEFTADCLREEPIGEDSSGALYYHLASNGEDCRIYRQMLPQLTGGKAPKLKTPETWETICTTMDELRDWIFQLKKLKPKVEKELYKTLSKEILPKLEESAAAREKQERKARELEAMPRKRSSRIASLATAKEEFDQRMEEEKIAREQKAKHAKEMQKLKKEQEMRERKEQARLERAAAREAALQEAALRRDRSFRLREMGYELPAESNREERMSKRQRGDEPDEYEDEQQFDAEPMQEDLQEDLQQSDEFDDSNTAAVEHRSPHDNESPAAPGVSAAWEEACGTVPSPVQAASPSPRPKVLVVKHQSYRAVLGSSPPPVEPQESKTFPPGADGLGSRDPPSDFEPASVPSASFPPSTQEDSFSDPRRSAEASADVTEPADASSLPLAAGATVASGVAEPVVQAREHTAAPMEEEAEEVQNTVLPVVENREEAECPEEAEEVQESSSPSGGKQRGGRVPGGKQRKLKIQVSQWWKTEEAECPEEAEEAQDPGLPVVENREEAECPEPLPSVPAEIPFQADAQMQVTSELADEMQPALAVASSTAMAPVEETPTSVEIPCNMDLPSVAVEHGDA